MRQFSVTIKIPNGRYVTVIVSAQSSYDAGAAAQAMFDGGEVAVVHQLD